MPMKYYLAPHRCENGDDGPDEPSCEKKKKNWALSGVINGSDGNDLGCGGLGNEMRRVWARCEDGSDRYVARCRVEMMVGKDF